MAVVVERRRDGSVVPRIGPSQKGVIRGWNAIDPHLRAALPGEMFYVAELDAMVLPVRNSDYCAGQFTPAMNCFGSPGNEPTALGRVGYGLRVFPLDVEESGYIGLTEPLGRYIRCDDQGATVESCRNLNPPTLSVGRPAG